MVGSEEKRESRSFGFVVVELFSNGRFAGLNEDLDGPVTVYTEQREAQKAADSMNVWYKKWRLKGNFVMAELKEV